jgi:hypothetical protein
MCTEVLLSNLHCNNGSRYEGILKSSDFNALHWLTWLKKCSSDERNSVIVSLTLTETSSNNKKHDIIVRTPSTKKAMLWDVTICSKLPQLLQLNYDVNNSLNSCSNIFYTTALELRSKSETYRTWKSHEWDVLSQNWYMFTWIPFHQLEL